MKLQNFFALNEGVLSEMAGMPKDNEYNGFMFKKLMEKYHATYDEDSAGAWPDGTSNKQKLSDVLRWHQEADAQGIYPSSNVTEQSVASGLDWPFRVGSGQASAGPAKNMRKLAVDVGFATQEQMDRLVEKEAKRMADRGESPKMGKVVGQAPTKKTYMNSPRPAEAPAVAAPAAASEPAPDDDQSSFDYKKKSSLDDIESDY